MSKVIVINHVTLDGVMQAPGRPDEDVRAGFRHGGWAVPNNDAVMGSMMAKGMSGRGALLLGRWTYESFAAFWPKQPEPNPFTAVLNQTQTYVASRTLKEPLPWSNSTLLTGDATDAVARLKQELDEDLVALGSGELVGSLMRCHLIDEYVLMIHPLILGSGRRLFADEGAAAALRLVDSVTTTKGVVIATYQAASQAAS